MSQTIPGITRHFVLAAGGTGGHMIPAHALAAELMRRGHRVALITDDRGARFPGLFDGVETHILPAGRLAGGPIGWLRALRGIQRGRAMARRLYRDFRPAAVVGFGGYPALPALLAAITLKIPTALHEQNAVAGRTNRLLARKVNLIATGFGGVSRLPDAVAGRIHVVGNPVRAEIAALRERPFPSFDDGDRLNILVTGGSQGATVLSQVVPAGLGELPDALRSRLSVVQQCRPEDIDRARGRYAALGITAELATYLPDMAERLADTHLMIGRAGASTLAELSMVGRPAILVPYPSATDDHQTANAREMTQAGGATTVPQPRFTAAEVARLVQALAEPGTLEKAASAARSVGRPNAAKDMADLVEGLGRTPVMDGLPRGSAPAKGAYA